MWNIKWNCYHKRKKSMQNEKCGADKSHCHVFVFIAEKFWEKI